MCPNMDKSDSRCAAHWTLQNIVRAFAHCADRYYDCPIYNQLLADRADHEPVKVSSRRLVAVS